MSAVFLLVLVDTFISSLAVTNRLLVVLTFVGFFSSCTSSFLHQVFLVISKV